MSIEEIKRCFEEQLILEGAVLLKGATDKELMILGRTKRARIRKKYFDRIERRRAAS